MEEVIAMINNSQMTETESLEKLEGLIGQVNVLMDSIVAMSGPANNDPQHLEASHFCAMLMREIRRSQRHNHYFAAAMLRLDQERMSDCIWVARNCFRETDLLGLVPSGEDEKGQRRFFLGVVMPETNRDGGITAAARAMRALQAQEDGYGLSVYPDDATDVDGLLKHAITSLTGDVQYSYAKEKGG